MSHAVEEHMHDSDDEVEHDVQGSSVMILQDQTLSCGSR